MTRRLARLGPVGLDPCSNPASGVDAMVRLDGSPGRDGLRWTWTGHGLVYVNPPYGRELTEWSRKASREARFGAEIVWLAPARTDTEWFHENILGRASAVLLWRGRIAFGNAPPGFKGTEGQDALATGVAVAYFGRREGAFRSAFRGAGVIFDPRLTPPLDAR